jgi:hypothetical protein
VDVVGDIFEVLATVPDGTVDAVHSYHFLEHVAPLDGIVRELAMSKARAFRAAKLQTAAREAFDFEQSANTTVLLEYVVKTLMADHVHAEVELERRGAVRLHLESGQRDQLPLRWFVPVVDVHRGVQRLLEPIPHRRPAQQEGGV